MNCQQEVRQKNSPLKDPFYPQQDPITGKDYNGVRREKKQICTTGFHLNKMSDVLPGLEIRRGLSEKKNTQQHGGMAELHILKCEQKKNGKPKHNGNIPLLFVSVLCVCEILLQHIYEFSYCTFTTYMHCVCICSKKCELDELCAWRGRKYISVLLHVVPSSISIFNAYI